MLGRLGDHAPAIVEPAPARAPGDLLELADREKAHLRPVELRELREEDRPDRDVHADAERVGPADDVEEPLLGELLHEKTVPGKEPGVVNADSERQESPELLAVGRREAFRAHDRPDLLPFLAAPDLHARERLRELGALALGEVHDVDGALLLLQEVFDRLVERGLAVLVVERHRPLLGRDVRDLAARVALQAFRDRASVAQRRRHQQELGPGQDEERHLPGDAALSVRVVVKLVHHDVGRREARAKAKRHVRQDLRRTADDARLRVDARVPGEHSDVLGPSSVQREKNFSLARALIGLV